MDKAALLFFFLVAKCTVCIREEKKNRKPLRVKNFRPEDLNVCFIHLICDTTHCQIKVVSLTRVTEILPAFRPDCCTTVVRGVNWLLVKRSFVRFIRRMKPSQLVPSTKRFMTAGSVMRRSRKSRYSLFLLVVIPSRTLIYRIYILRPVPRPLVTFRLLN